MSSRYTKIKYKEEGTYGSIEEKWLYCADIGCSDITTFYDEDGTHILSINNTLDNNMFVKMIEIYQNWNPDNNPNVERVTSEEYKNIFKK